MKRSKNNTYWLLALAGIAVTFGWYVSNSLNKPIIFLTCAIIAFLAGAYVLTATDKKISEKNNQNFADIMRIATENRKVIVNGIEAISNTMRGEATDLRMIIQQTEETLKTDSGENTSKIQEMMSENHAKLCNTISMNKKENSAALSEIQSKLLEQEQLHQKVHSELREDMQAIAGSFENAVVAYGEMERRMAALEQQNVHLQMLTTMIGTTRSDVALLNEVKGFVKEQKEGRKIRLIRDDEHGVVVENLMNSDGVRIEKSKMFREKKLVFEAEFDAMGKMILSRSFDNGELSTEVTYAPENKGRPSLKDVAKEKITGVLNWKK